MVDGYEGKLDVSEVLDGDNHVVEHHHLAAVDAEQALERGQGAKLEAHTKEEGGVFGGAAPETGRQRRHQTGHSRGVVKLTFEKLLN